MILRYNNIVKKLIQLFLIMNAKRACETFYTHTAITAVWPSPHHLFYGPHSIYSSKVVVNSSMRWANKIFGISILKLP